MLDLIGIVFSSTMMLLVIFRAIQMDAQTPWYRLPKTGSDSSGLRLRPAEEEAPRDEVLKARAARNRPPRSR